MNKPTLSLISTHCMSVTFGRHLERHVETTRTGPWDGVREVQRHGKEAWGRMQVVQGWTAPRRVLLLPAALSAARSQALSPAALPVSSPRFLSAHSRLPIPSLQSDPQGVSAPKISAHSPCDERTNRYPSAFPNDSSAPLLAKPYMFWGRFSACYTLTNPFSPGFATSLKPTMKNPQLLCPNRHH